MARQFNLIPPVCEQAEYHLFQREKVEVQLPELYHKIGKLCLCVSCAFFFPGTFFTSLCNISGQFNSLWSLWWQELERWRGHRLHAASSQESMKMAFLSPPGPPWRWAGSLHHCVVNVQNLRVTCCAPKIKYGVKRRRAFITGFISSPQFVQTLRDKWDEGSWSSMFFI